MKSEKCPRCGSDSNMPGRLFDAIAGMPPFYFRPKGLKLVTLSAVDVKADASGFRACAECGLLWSSVDPKRLKEIVKKSGGARLRKSMQLT